MVLIDKNKNSKFFSVMKMSIWLIYAMIALSGWSYYLLCDVLGLPFYVYEVFFVPIIFIYRNKIISGFGKIRKIYVFVALLLVFFLLFGLVINTKYMIEQITTYRTIFYVFVFMYFFSIEKKFDIKFLQILCTGASLGEFLFIQIISNSRDQIALNIVALSLMVIIPVIKNSLTETIFFTVFALIVSFRSSFRINIVIVLIALLISVLYVMMIQKKIKALILTVIIAIAGITIAINFDSIVDLLVNILKIDNAMSVYRITNRLKALFQADFQSSQDTVRFMLMAQIFTEFDVYFVPCGLIGKAINMYGRYKDAPIIFFYHAFGSPVSIALLGYIVTKACCFIKKYMFVKKNELSIFGLMLPIYIVLFFLNGTFIINTYEACLTGIVLGYWFNYNKIEVII